jgi:hypothetical protein
MSLSLTGTHPGLQLPLQLTPIVSDPGLFNNDWLLVNHLLSLPNFKKK